MARALRKKSQAVSSGLRACGSHGSNGEAPAREEALLLGVIVPSPGGGDRSGAAGGEEDMRALLQTKGLLVHDSMAAKKVPQPTEFAVESCPAVVISLLSV